MAEGLTKLEIAGLQECARACLPGVNYGMHRGWKPTTMRRLHARGLVAEGIRLQSIYGATPFRGWRITEAGKEALASLPDNRRTG